MTEVLQSPSHFPSSTSTISSSTTPSSLTCIPPQFPSCSLLADGEDSTLTVCDPEEVVDTDKQSRDHLSLLAILVTIFRKSLAVCKSGRRELCAMEIGCPTNVRHVAHVTFDRFNGFLGLPVEFEPEVPRRAPSASATVFGVSTESMQLSYDSRGHSVPTILLLMQNRLYAQGGLQAEGIFRINAGNSQEEYVRDELNRGLVPDGIDVHCLAGLIKAWFRELPTGILDSLSPEQVMQCQIEEDCAELVRLLPPTEAALLDWAINLMADVVEQEHLNKMNARNIAMVFAPNMTQMADPLTALMYAVQVMNFLKTLILRTLQARQDSIVEPTPACRVDPNDENGDQSPSQSCMEDAEKGSGEVDQAFIVKESIVGSSSNSCEDIDIIDVEEPSPLTAVEKQSTKGNCPFQTVANAEMFSNEVKEGGVNVLKDAVQKNCGKSDIGQSSTTNFSKGASKMNRQQTLQVAEPVEKTCGISTLSHIDSRTERIEAWR
ncbi:rho GTPase-activating protein 1 [Tripterygium wilfordii]|uniref:Rho GTPase-activating protein 1 n=1 Tax=Tripterygium wilfordii TaxID=458696 RepID=A0A7J7DF29_TRIWF|nr:rho GTPase-activating protein 5-like [Tripterygium wilfordii]KAF5744879.1 rho GTPase-activating protein 1 [Tripterygium wilfordii]